MSDNNPDQIPTSQPAAGPGNHEVNPDWTIGEVLSEAWKLKDGFKGTYWGALLIYAVITVVITGVLEFIANDSSMMKVISQLITGFITYPLVVGMMMIAIKRSVGIPTNVAMVFDYYPKTMPIFLTYLLMPLLIFIGFLLLVLPGIYLAIAYALALPLLVDKNMGIWEAMEASRKAITPCWFRVFGLFLLGGIILMISALPLGIGLIWTVPFFGLAAAIVYRNLVGVSQSA